MHHATWRRLRSSLGALLLLSSLAGALDLPAGYPTWYRCIRYGGKHCDLIRAAMPTSAADIFGSWDPWRAVYLCGLVLGIALLLPSSDYGVLHARRRPRTAAGRVSLAHRRLVESPRVKRGFYVQRWDER